jgi:hypothetical protein
MRWPEGEIQETDSQSGDPDDFSGNLSAIVEIADRDQSESCDQM